MSSPNKQTYRVHNDDFYALIAALAEVRAILQEQDDHSMTHRDRAAYNRVALARLARIERSISLFFPVYVPHTEDELPF